MGRKTVIPALAFDPSGAMIPEIGLDRAEVSAIWPRLEAARSEILAGGGFVDLPDRLLAEYQAHRHRSEVGRIMKTARRLAEMADAFVLLAGEGEQLGPRALFEACCHPYQNSLGRGDRGGHPRFYFAGHHLDNDTTQGLLDVLGAGRPARDLADRWGIVVIGKHGRRLETAVALQQFWAALRESCQGDVALAARLVVPITGASGRLAELARDIGCSDAYDIPENVDSRFSVLSAVGLLPAALVGLDVIKLLEGAAAMNAHFRAAPADENIVLNFAAVGHLIQVCRGATVRVWACWTPAIEAAGRWYKQLLVGAGEQAPLSAAPNGALALPAHCVAGSRAEGGPFALPLSVLQPQDYQTRGRQFPAGKTWITNVIVDTPRRDRLAIDPARLHLEQPGGLTGKTLPELMAAAIGSATRGSVEHGVATADLHLPQLDEASLGQLFQMLMLATAVEDAVQSPE